MIKITRAIQTKSMPFAVVVGDQPVYTLLVEIKMSIYKNMKKLFRFLVLFILKAV